MPKKNVQKRKSKASIPLIFAGILVIGLAFVFSLQSITHFWNDGNQNEEAPTHQSFIDQLAPHAKELQQGYGILPSIILGQAILESNWGQSQLASQYNNLFGIKASGNQPKVSLETKEYVNEQWITIQGEFKVYQSWEESLDDHTMLFVNGTNWDPQLYANVLTATDYKAAAQALQTAGYATDPDYANKIISVIETYNLGQYDHP
ncbi:glycoside hydrolase family 73 protein [Enterococcus dongliensis]|uniref:Glycoside hydrolase family 73 protein n=1 Tax=Enterococcus dongliensis TaxID=2559925 RepID=A0AAW8THN7_9ENTE|nr:glycoside hydrolase family 73 protein [Enterococcus dongliensis]MDT2595657.1 glycoside hydrolase family 73 protein [Enterococcus dongliensis]MDT2604262.1 glycoside hydrolase family 73 protein [Enterococcus dongliensis]MDT2614441.1 glycoside hydrolase family 73 protein [Enterococcus dongliensis]MDT2635048.1 glycoside hydrolase family 73 protein [Enterococcus dongliensis]MDT2636269.1 glycoside hydrolase family 73 protein [Enterococcus dongliensis]